MLVWGGRCFRRFLTSIQIFLLKLLCNLLISFFSIVLMFSGIRKERSRNLWFTDFISQFMGPEEVLANAVILLIIKEIVSSSC